MVTLIGVCINRPIYVFGLPQDPQGHVVHVGPMVNLH